MKLYEKIITIIEEKGPLPLPSICEEINHMQSLEKSLQTLPDEVHSIISTKSELFQINNGAICLKPNKVPFTLNAYIDSFEGSSYQVCVNFQRKNFVYLQFEKRSNKKIPIPENGKTAGDIASFKRQLYSIRLWEWEPSYRSGQGIIIDGTNWSVSLKTKGETYKSNGMNRFPPNWGMFCQSIEKLTGSTFR